jgi:chromosome segregation ATPase
MSAPNSPARGSSNNNSMAAPIARLPSQDSLDRSIHNDSGHGKSTAQIILGLKQSNSRLTARTAAIEVDFMNQLQQTTVRSEHEKKSLEDSLKQKEKHVGTLESRCKTAEGRIREKDEGLNKLKEESAFQRHAISDLKTQLHQMSQEVEYGQGHGNRDTSSSSVGVEDWNAEKQSLLREVETLKKDNARQAEEKLVSKQEIDKLKRVVADGQAKSDRSARSSSDPEGSPSRSVKQLEKTQNALDKTESALADLQSEKVRLSAQHAQSLTDFKEELKSSKTHWRQKEGDLLSKISKLEESELAGDLESKLVDRDATIAKLRDEGLEYSLQLTALTENMAKLKANAESQEQYRRDEADDLRVLSDAQEEEIDDLRKQLEDALREVDMRGQELEEVRERGAEPKSAASADRDEAVWEESSQILATLQGRLDDSHETLEGLQQALEETKEDHERHVASLQYKLNESDKEKNLLLAKLESQAKDQERSPAKVEKNTIAEDYKKQIVILQDQKEMVESEYESRLIAQETELARLRQSVKAQETELAKLQQSSSSAGESTADDARANESKKTGQSGGSLEEDLRKELHTAQLSGKRVEEDLRTELQTAKLAGKRNTAELNAVVEERETLLIELRQKLEDRDTTISALVKSSVSLEEQIASTKSEVDDLRARLSQNYGEEGVDIILDRPFESKLNLEVEDLRTSLVAARELEERTQNEVFRLKKQVHHAKRETTRIRVQMEEDKAKNDALSAQLEENSLGKDGEKKLADVAGPTHQRELQERDDAISNLVNQSMMKERQLTELQVRSSIMSKELEFLRSDEKSGALTWEEAKSLRQEAEMFAGQVIEQDEEIEGLRNALQARETHVVEIQKELNEIKSKPVLSKIDASTVQDMEAEIDELKEGNSVQRDELRILRRTARDFETVADTISEAKRWEQFAKSDAEKYKKTADDLAREKTALLKELDEGKTSNLSYNDKVKELEASQLSSIDKIASLEAALKELDRMTKNAETSATTRGSNVDEMEMEALKDEKKSLERNLASQSAAVDIARNTIRDLERMLAEKTSEEANALEEEKEELLAEIESLTTEVEKLKHQIALMEEERCLIEVFKEKLEQADEARLASEKAIVDNYERKISLLTLDKDVTIDKTRKELVEEKQVNAEEMELMSNRIGEYETEIKDLKEEMLAQLEQREAKIYALEHTLHAQEQLVGNMRSEMDHLQGSMVSTAAGRREEIEDMQQELVDLTSRAAAQEREITSQRMQLEEKNLEHKTEVAKLTGTISSLESSEETATHRTAAELQMDIRVREVKDRLEKLRWRNETLQEENTTLRQRLVKAEEAMNSSNSDEIKSAALRIELKDQKMRVKELEVEMRIAAVKREAAKASQKPPVAPGPPIAPGPPPPLRSESPGTRSVSGSSPRRLGFLGRRRANSQDQVEGNK